MGNLYPGGSSVSSAHITPNAASKRAIVKATATIFSSFFTCQKNNLVFFVWLAITSYNIRFNPNS